MKLLIVDSSPRAEKSRSRKLAQFFCERWTAQFPNDEIIQRDIGEDAPMHISEEWMHAAYTPPDKRTEGMLSLLNTSAEFVVELQQANYLLVACPMYNFSIPSSLKAYIDQVFRLGETFRLEKGKYVGLLKGTKAFIICAKGGFYKESDQPDFSTPYIQHILKTLGFPEIITIDAEGLDISKDSEIRGMESAKATIQNVIHSLARERAPHA